MEAAWRTRLAGLGVAARIHPWRTAVALVWLLVIVVCALGLAIWLVGTTLALLGSLALLAGVVAVAWGSNRGDPGPSGGLHRVLHGLETPRLALRRPVPADAPAIFATVDAEVIRANGWTEDGIRSLRLAIMHPRLVESAAGTLLTDRASGAVIGALEIYGWDRERRTCCVGWYLGPLHRGKGYSTEALRAVLPALHAAGVSEVRLAASPDDVAIQRIAGKLGLRPLPSGPHTLPDGCTVTSLWYASTADLGTASALPSPGH